MSGLAQSPVLAIEYLSIENFLVDESTRRCWSSLRYTGPKLKISLTLYGAKLWRCRICRVQRSF